MESPIETLSHLLALYQMIKFAIDLALAAIRYVRSKIGTRPPPKPGTDCPEAGITINITYNINNICNEHHYPPCTHSGKTARRRRGRSARRRSLR